ncbi:hypothetical protein [Natronococcus pandeyae]|nr:hypothetical protein [Natronococcus pandeyae]
MSFDRSKLDVTAVYSRWTTLEHDWQSVVVGAVVVAVAGAVRIPW